jgi:hypothetical protein
MAAPEALKINFLSIDKASMWKIAFCPASKSSLVYFLHSSTKIELHVQFDRPCTNGSVCSEGFCKESQALGRREQASTLQVVENLTKCSSAAGSNIPVNSTFQRLDLGTLP